MINKQFVTCGLLSRVGCVENLTMGKLHRDLATFLMQCCTNDENKTNLQCVEVSYACLLISRCQYDFFIVYSYPSSLYQMSQERSIIVDMLISAR